MVFSGNRVTHAPHQTNCYFKAKANIKLSRHISKHKSLTNPRDIVIYNNILHKINNALFFLNWRIFSRKVLCKG